MKLEDLNWKQGLRRVWFVWCAICGIIALFLLLVMLNGEYSYIDSIGDVLGAILMSLVIGGVLAFMPRIPDLGYRLFKWVQAGFLPPSDPTA